MHFQTLEDINSLKSKSRINLQLSLECIIYILINIETWN